MHSTTRLDMLTLSLKQYNVSGVYIDEYNCIYHIKNNLYHREDGPAIEHVTGSKRWYINGIAHRLDGPAVEYYNGNKYWFYRGEQINVKSQEEFEQHLRLKSFW